MHRTRKMTWVKTHVSRTSELMTTATNSTVNHRLLSVGSHDTCSARCLRYKCGGEALRYCSMDPLDVLTKMWKMAM